MDKKLEGVGKIRSKLSAKVIYPDGRVEDKGILSRKVVTNAFVQYLVDSMQDSTSYPMDVFKYHGSGTGTGEEAAGDSALGTEVGSRVEGTQTEDDADDYQTVATVTYSGTSAITEHGVFSASEAGTLMDRSKFDAINVTNGMQIQFTYTINFASGS